MTTLAEVESELLSYAPNRMYGADYQLERIRALMERIGNPQDELKVIHITGTSGKTSTAYYVRAILEEAGAKTGLTVSPHIKTICERIQIGGEPILEADFVTYFNEFYPLVFGFEPRPTYFELMTALAYWVFKKVKVDYAVIEVGLGGRFDATNIVSRDDKVCVINSIGYDHTEIFGESLTAIAKEKAGIIQAHNTVFTVKQDDEAWAVLEAEAREKHATLTVVNTAINHESPAPTFQQRNSQLALAAVRYVARRDGLKLPVDVESIVEKVTIPGRFETYKIGEKTIILDGAHNPQKLEALLGTLREKNMQPAVAVAGISEAPEAKVAKCVRLLSEFSDKSVYTTFTVQRDVMRRSVGPEELAKFKRARDELVALPVDALQQALKSEEDYVIVTGSLYLVSILRPVVRRLAHLSE